MSEPMWRVGRHQPINLYYGGEYVGVAFGSPAIAAAIVARMNEDRPVPPEVGVDWGAVEKALEQPFPMEHANALQGAFNILLQRQKDAVAEVEGFMQSEHREKCGGNGNLEDYGFGKCKHEVCAGYRERLTELRATS